ncbi:hypothetical protein QJS10_CPA06g01104 [Acorus calamus]|uniref:Uncharacterized protein n=1 Tax=Acorus calamus TaxID=4465 RepID=A0AAV9EM81_ACOCL|nr:hypothetical protein QJS10_CPA06g01104 [Acorus calamus]
METFVASSRVPKVVRRSKFLVVPYQGCLFLRFWWWQVGKALRKARSLSWFVGFRGKAFRTEEQK